MDCGYWDLPGNAKYPIIAQYIYIYIYRVLKPSVWVLWRSRTFRSNKVSGPHRCSQFLEPERLHKPKDLTFWFQYTGEYQNLMLCRIFLLVHHVLYTTYHILSTIPSAAIHYRIGAGPFHLPGASGTATGSSGGRGSRTSNPPTRDPIAPHPA